MGTDIVYSGTCGAARQAVLNGVPAIALSVNPEVWDEEHINALKYDAIADFAAKNLETVSWTGKESKKGSFGYALTDKMYSVSDKGVVTCVVTISQKNKKILLGTIFLKKV